jgi:hypothetical protein
LHDEELLAAAEQSVRTTARIISNSRLLAAEHDQQFAGVAQAAVALEPHLTVAARCARSVSDYTEDFFLALGPHLRKIEDGYGLLTSAVALMRPTKRTSDRS